MADALQTLIESGTKLFLDSVDPPEIDKNLARGAVGATSNPAIISAIVKKGALDDRIESLIAAGHDDDAIAWQLADHLVTDAEQKFLPIHQQSGGNAGWISFELDPLLEDPSRREPIEQTVARYVELGQRWSDGHTNRMIKVPATEAGLGALEELAAAGVTLNVTLMFTADQYRSAREAIWRGAQRAGNLSHFKSVYSIFVSRIDVYTAKHVPELSEAAQGTVGILNAKRLWRENQAFWADKGLPLEQELIFASLGTKDPNDPPWKYVEALAGSDIQTNPPETNDAVAESGREITRGVDQMPPQSVQDEIDRKLDIAEMHRVLMEEGIDKFVQPQLALLSVIAEKRKQLSPSR